MIELCYSTFGMTKLDFMEAIEAVDRAGYAGVELAFHRDQFNVFNVTDEYLEAIRERFKGLRARPACVATASHFFTPSRPHEPSLMSPDLAGRKRRIDLIRRGIHVARKVGAPFVTFGSGFIREEHLLHSEVNPHELLVDSIHQCLRALRDDDEITLLIEPEPGMYIETVEQAIRLVKDVNSPRFALHIDLCHMYCSEKDFVAELARVAPYTRYLHVSDARQGYNLKILAWSPELELDMDFASYLIYFPDTAEYLLVDRQHPLYFYDEFKPGAARQKQIEELLGRAQVTASLQYVDYTTLYAGASPFDDEIFTYLISVPRLSFEVLERARPILLYLRRPIHDGKPLVDRMVANTLTGIVHFHEIPGEGTFDFATAFKTLSDHGYSGYASVELYHHVESWEKALHDSYRHLSQFVG
jgi:sugar phosphate isomerase/epimerase